MKLAFFVAGLFLVIVGFLVMLRPNKELSAKMSDVVGFPLIPIGLGLLWAAYDQ